MLPLNFASISFESPFDRDTVERCCKEIVSSTARALAAKRNIELCFTGIGRLTIREGRVKMKFYKEFINEMDVSGKLVDTMMNVSEIDRYLIYCMMIVSYICSSLRLGQSLQLSI